MRTLAPSPRPASELDPISRVVLEFEEAWRSGPPPPRSVPRPARGRRPLRPGGAGEGRPPEPLPPRRAPPPPASTSTASPSSPPRGGRALSLIYEEYCLRVEAKEAIDASEFCRDYPTWRDSLESQLAYHRDLSRAVEPLAPDDRPEFPRAGDRFGDYELVEILGEGLDRPRLPRQPGVARRQAVRPEDLAPDRGVEPEILGKLDHPSIIPVDLLGRRPPADRALRGPLHAVSPGPAAGQS